MQNTRPIVFLHIPKTAGQTIHNEITRVVGTENVSPVRVHTQVQNQDCQMSNGYRFYSGHIDWTELKRLENPHTFTVLRDPKERIASFYFYLRKEARRLSATALQQPENIGKIRALQWSARDYFFGGDPNWRSFIKDHYDNFYCSYFATQKMRGRREILHLSQTKKLACAIHNSALIDCIYTTQNLTPLERDLNALLGADLKISGTYTNAGHIPQNEPRWPRLLDRLGSDKEAARLTAFTTLDADFMQSVL